MAKVGTKTKFRRTPKQLRLSEGAGEEYAKRIKTFSGERGVKTKLDELTIDLIANALSKGHTAQFACAGAGVVYDNLLVWIKKGKEDFERLSILDSQGIELRDEDYSIYFELFMRVQRCLYESQDTPLTILQEAARSGEWRAAAHFLERRFPKDWGRPRVSEDKGPAIVNNIKAVIKVPQRANSIEDWVEVKDAEEAGKVKYIEQAQDQNALEDEQDQKSSNFEELTGIPI